MKRTVIAVAIALIAVGAAAAQPWAGQNGSNLPPAMRQNGFGPGYGYSSQFAALAFEKLSLEGTLSLVNSYPAIQQDGKTYYVMIPNRLYGFVDGLKEGASVKIDGYAREVPGVKDTYVVRVSSLTLNGKTINLSAAYGTMGYGRGMMGGGFGPGAGYGQMPMGRW